MSGSIPTNPPVRESVAIVLLDRDDDVAVAIRDLPAGGTVSRGVTGRGDVPRGHKIAARDVAAGGLVRKYRQPIGAATTHVTAGDHVQSHNLGMPDAPASPTAAPTFDGIRRPDGRVATRNYLVVLSTVNCSATVAKRIAAQAETRGLLNAAPGVDGIVALTHGTGCGMARDGDGRPAAQLEAVYEYAQQVTARGLGFMDTPGYDPVSVTGMVAGGANIVAFTTGRGSVFGCKPVPSLKLSTNSDIYRRMPEDMDLDCGTIVTEGKSLDAVGSRIFERLIEVASGRRTASEELGFGDKEFVPWQLGAVM